MSTQNVFPSLRMAFFLQLSIFKTLGSTLHFYTTYNKGREEAKLSFDLQEASDEQESN